MAAQNKVAETGGDKKRMKSRPEAMFNPAAIPDDLAPISPDASSFANGGSIETQANRLNNPRLPTVRRQALAAQIGRVQGNQHLQRIVNRIKQNKPARLPDQSGPNGALQPSKEQDSVVQAAREENVTPWGSTYMSVEVKPIPDKLIGNINLNPESTGNYPIITEYHGRLAYKGDAYRGIEGPDGKDVVHEGRASFDEALKFNKNLRSTAPGRYKAYLGNRGGTFADAIRAEESFTVVDPVQINLNSRRARDIYDFDNPIPVQMEGVSELKYKLDASRLHSKSVGVSASGSNSNSVSDKVSFGISAGLDNDAGAKAKGEYGISTETQHSWQEQWNNETTHKSETKTEEWMEETFKPEPKTKGISKMIIPQYEWVEWDAVVYPHNPSNLVTTGGPTTVVIGMLRPTGRFQTQRSTDPGQDSDSDPTARAQTDVERSDPELSGQHDAQVAAQGAWRTLPGVRWGSGVLQFIQGPITITPAGRDYGMQDGRDVAKGEGEWSTGNSLSMSVENGLVTSSSQDSSFVTTNNESKSLEAEIGKKGFGAIGDSLKFENANSVSSATGTGLSTSAGTKEETTIEVSHTVAKKPHQRQYVMFTPLVDHKVFKVAYGATQPPGGGNVVDPDQACSIIYVHTYQHQPIPHVKVMDIGRHGTPPRGRYKWPEHTEV